jgi:hypothetical protein
MAPFLASHGRPCSPGSTRITHGEPDVLELVSAAAQGLAASNLTVLNGTDGLGQIMTGLVGQGLTVLDALRRSTAAVPPASLSHDGHDGHDGSAAESSPALS